MIGVIIQAVADIIVVAIVAVAVIASVIETRETIINNLAAVVIKSPF